MFDTYQLGPSVPSHTSVSVTEKRAPTDDSVKLLREMESEARSEVLHAGRLGDNWLQGDWYIYRDHFNLKTEAKWVYKLNGTLVEGTVELDKWGLQRDGIEEAMRLVHESVLSRLAGQISVGVVKTYPKGAQMP